MASKPKEIILSQQAAEELDELHEYLLLEFGRTALEKFHQKWEQFLSVVSRHPRIFPLLHKRKNLRKYAIHPKTIIVYKSSKQFIEIVTLFNTRKNPATLKKTIKRV
ncbi:MAG: type II toxin-antitoxin system RelE/ParE family toxin [Chitinophagaceae bacterium]|nr:type II toxin-antitoxin system RelE/ParE family toxin [Chitinophagaceae bacterium]